MKRFIVIVVCVLYVLSPLDLAPDFIPVLGQIDDLGAALIGLRALLK